MHPVGPLPPRVYWLRRVIILVLAVVVLLGLVYLVVGRRSASTAASGDSSSSSSSVRPSMTGVLAATSSSKTSTTSSAEPTTEVPTSSPEPEPAPASTPEPSPAAPSPDPAAVPSETVASEPAPVEPAPVEPPPPATTEEPPPPPVRQQDAEGRDLCFDNEITLTAVASGPYGFGQQPVIGVRVQNTGAVPCTRDVSASLQVFTVLGADGSHIWSTSDCFPGQGTEVRTLAPGETLEYQVKWSGTTSQPGCTGDRVPVPVGSYQLIAAIGGVQSGPTPFEITG